MDGRVRLFFLSSYNRSKMGPFIFEHEICIKCTIIGNMSSLHRYIQTGRLTLPWRHCVLNYKDQYTVVYAKTHEHRPIIATCSTLRYHHKGSFNIWAESSEFVSSSIPSWQILTAHAQPFRGARDLAFCLKVPHFSLLVWASSGGSGETARMRRLAWTFAARIGDKYQIRLARPIYITVRKWVNIF